MKPMTMMMMLTQTIKTNPRIMTLVMMHRTIIVTQKIKVKDASPKKMKLQAMLQFTLKLVASTTTKKTLPRTMKVVI